MKNDKKRVLVVEDEPLILLDMVETLEDAGFSVLAARTVAEALARLEEVSVRAAALDVDVAGERPTEVAARLRHMTVPYIICSAYARHQVGAWASPIAFVQKPIAPERLVRCIELAFEATDCGA